MTKDPSKIEEVIELMKTRQLEVQQSYLFIIKIEEKIKRDIDILFEKLAGGHIHEIQSKIGFAKNVLKFVLESKGAFDYTKALDSAITQLDDILALYRKSGVSLSLNDEK